MQVTNTVRSNESVIPKVIHYCWFGHNPKSDLVLRCIQSWKDIMPDYEIKEWNESNFDVNSNSYTQLAYENKKWAFVSDYARLKVLYEHGGIYLDTDMYVLKNFDDFLSYDLALGKEDEKHISAGMIANKKNNLFIKKCIEYYNESSQLVPIPKILTNIFEDNKNIIKENLINNIKIFDPVYFYPFTDENIYDFNYNNAPVKSYGVHMWNYSWGHPLNKFIKKIGIHKILVKFLDKLKVKKIIKRVLKME